MSLCPDPAGPGSATAISRPPRGNASAPLPPGPGVGSADLSQVASLPRSRGHLCVPPAGVPPGGDISTFPLIYPLFPARVSAAPPSRSAHPCPAPGLAPRAKPGFGVPWGWARQGSRDRDPSSLLWPSRARSYSWECRQALVVQSISRPHTGTSHRTISPTSSSPISQIPEFPKKLSLGAAVAP